MNWNIFSFFKIFYIIDWKRRKEARKKQSAREERKPTLKLNLLSTESVLQFLHGL